MELMSSTSNKAIMNQGVEAAYWSEGKIDVRKDSAFYTQG